MLLPSPGKVRKHGAGLGISLITGFVKINW